MNPYARRYVLHGLAATPLVLETLLKGATSAEVDLRRDPDRFTIREALAHLSDWEAIWRERIGRILTEEKPALLGYDEGQIALDRDYARRPLAESLARLSAERPLLVKTLSELSPEQWARTGVRDEIGPVTINDLAALVLGHDGYHLRQVVEFRAAASAANQ